MAQATDAVWLPVLPSFKEFGPALSKGAGAEADKSGKAVGARFGKALVVGTAAVGAAAIGAGAALYKVGEVFDDVADTIRVGTGATGAALDGLVDSAKNVGKSVPADFEKVGTVVADINTRLGLSGATLETVASQYLEAGRILGEEVDITKTSAAFSAFKIEGEGVVGAMDHLFQVSQATGVGMNELAEGAARNAPAMEILGFSFEETTAMIGSFDKAGLNSSALMASMSKGMVTLAKDGEEPAAAFKRVQEEITGFVAAGDDAAALDLAAEVFGTKGASQFIGAVKSGALNLEDMSKAAGQTGDSILGVGAETMDFAEQWTMFKNNVLVWLEPMGARVFGALGTIMGEVTDGVKAFGAAWKYNDGEVTSSGIPGLMERLGFYARQAFDYFQVNVMPVLREFGEYVKGTVVPALLSFGKWMKENAATLAVVAAGIVTYVAVAKTMSIIKTITVAIKAMNVAFKANPIGIVITALTLLVAGLVYAYNNVGWFKDAVDAAFSGIKTAIGAVVDWFQNTVLPALSAVWTAISDGAMWLWNNGIKPAWDGIMTAVRVVADWFRNTLAPAIKSVFDGVGAVFTWLYKNIISPVFAGIKWTINAWWQVVSAIFSLVVGFLRNTLGVAFSWLYNNVITPVFNGIKWLITTWWTGVKVIFDAVVGFLRNTLGPVFSWLKDNIINPVWNGIKTTISNVWNNGIKPIFDALMQVVRDKIPAAFEAAKDGIGKAWDKIRDIAKKPVVFVVDTVIGGLVDTFNKIPGVNIAKPRLPAGFKKGGYTGDGPADEIAGPAHRGEFYFSKKQTRAIGRQKLAAMAHEATHGGAAATAGGAAIGSGVFGGIPSFQGPQFQRIDNADAVTVGGDSGSKSRWFLKQAAEMWNGLANVRVLTGAAQAGVPYVHAQETSRLPFAPIPNWAGYYAGSQVYLNPSLAGMAPTARRTVAAHEIGHALGLPHAMQTGAYSIMNYDTMYKANAPTAADAAALRSIYGGVGSASSKIQPLPDEKASNPFDGLIDSLMSKFKKQFPEGGMIIDSIGGLVKSAIEKVTKWIQDIKDGIKNVAGDVANNIRGFFGGGAATAGSSDSMAYLHDNGGVLRPGLSSILNNTGKPEAILNSQQWSDIRSLAARGANGSRDGMEFNFNGPIYGNPQHIADELRTQQRRAISRHDVRKVMA